MTTEENKKEKPMPYRSNTERRSGIDIRSEDLKKQQGERRSGTDRRR
ncbi:MAG: hypothetical protein ABJM86_01495 [Hyphomicrobiales bacterium]